MDDPAHLGAPLVDASKPATDVWPAVLRRRAIRRPFVSTEDGDDVHNRLIDGKRHQPGTFHVCVSEVYLDPPPPVNCRPQEPVRETVKFLGTGKPGNMEIFRVAGTGRPVR